MTKLSACLLAAALLGLLAPCAHASISVSGATAAERTQLLFQQKSRAHQKSLAAIMNNMTLTSALQVLHHGSAKPQLMELVQGALQKNQGKSSSHLRAGAAQLPSGYSGVDKAKDMLNEMLLEVQTKYDIELQKCCSYDEEQSVLIEESRQDISMFNAEAAEARKECLEADSIMQMCDIKLPELTDALQTHNRECQEEISALRAQLKIVMGDVAVMDTILGMTDCAKSLFLLRCEDSCTGQAFVTFSHDGLHNAVTSLRSSSVKQLLNDGLMEAYGQTNLTLGANVTTWAPASTVPMTVPRSRPCKQPVPADKRTGKCSMNSNPNCAKMQERFKYIQAGIEDKRDELQAQVAKLVVDCKHTKANLEAQISDFEIKLKDAQASLAAGTKKQNNAEGQSRLKSAEFKSLSADYERMTTTCHTNYATLESEDCGIRKIRGELYKMQGQNNPAFFQDCVVGEWKADECSASCGGGAMRLTRSVVTHPVGGSKCPMLAATKPCNEDKCPIDCRLRDWQGWSECSAKCGGGLMARTRAVIIEPMHGGEPCGETSEAEGCNVQACDADCELSDWSGWSLCSKECDGGTQERGRTITVAPIGDGTCADIRSAERHEEHSCNAHACIKTNPSPTLQCRSKADVILVIDGSGSLGQRGWDASVKGGAMLARAFGGKGADIKLAVLLFSRKAEWVTHFSSDIEAAALAIEKLTWPRSWTYTSTALYAANSELSLGRDDAPSVVIVITDGRPMSMRRTWFASRWLRRKARLMFVPVTRYAPVRFMRHMASYPKNENFLALDSFEALEDPKNLDLIIADVCPDVE